MMNGRNLIQEKCSSVRGHHLTAKVALGFGVAPCASAEQLDAEPALQIETGGANPEPTPRTDRLSIASPVRVSDSAAPSCDDPRSGSSPAACTRFQNRQTLVGSQPLESLPTTRWPADLQFIHHFRRAETEVKHL